MSETPNRWHALLHTRFRGQATPLLVMPDTLWSAASQWAGARAWIKAFRAAGLAAGDRVVCALPPGPGFVQVMLACLWESITFAPVEPQADLRSASATVQPRLCIALAGAEGGDVPCWTPDAAWQPPASVESLPTRETSAATSEPPALLLMQRGSDGGLQMLRLSTDDVFTQLDAHRAALALDDAIVLSVLPWCQADSLVLGVLASLRDASEILVAHALLPDPAAMVAFVDAHPVTRVDRSLVRMAERRRVGAPRRAKQLVPAAR